MARGFSVVAVVLLHVGLFHVFPLAPDDHGRPLARAWVLVNTAILADLRMPLLLLLSGYLARTKIRQGWAFARTRLAVVTNAYLYLVWTLVFFALGVLFLADDRSFDTFSPAGLGLSLLYPQSGPLWFVYVLAVSVAVLALTRRAPKPVVLGGFFVVGWAIVAAGGTEAGLPRAIFFAAGALVGDHLVALTGLWLASLVALVGYAVLTAAGEHLHLMAAYPLDVVGGLCAAVAFLGLARLVARVKILREPGAWIGRRTLAVYVLHWPLVAALSWVGSHHRGLFAPWLRSQVVEVLYPVVLTSLVVAICLLLHRLLYRVGLGFLFEPPAVLTRRVTRGAKTSSARTAPSAQTAPITVTDPAPHGAEPALHAGSVPKTSS